ncbi:MAG: thioredoxin [Steroidobacteraceae bacterium]|jgi:putative thioredoxin|nr:thioredoxin [Steroidobacteraceae bacterium]
MSELTPAVGRDNFEAEVLAASVSMPVLVDFWAEWCGPCKMLAPTLERLAAAYAGRAKVVKVDTDAEQQLAAHFGIRSIPTIKLFRHGRPVEDAVGVQPEGALRALIERHLEQPSDRVLAEAGGLIGDDQPEQAVLLLEALLRDEPDHVPAQVLLIEALVRAGRTDEAEARLAVLPVQALEAPQLAAVEARLHFAKLMKAAPAEEALQKRVAADPGDLEAQHQLAAREVTAGRGKAALERLIAAMQRDRRFGEDLARRSLLHAFALLGDQEDVVHHYRRRMMALMH